MFVTTFFYSLHSWTLSCLRPQIAEWWSSANGAVNFCVVTYRVIHIGLVIFGDEVDKADVTCFAELVSSETKELVPFSPKLYSNPTHYRSFLLHRDNARLGPVYLRRRSYLTSPPKNTTGSPFEMQIFE